MSAPLDVLLQRKRDAIYEQQAVDDALSGAKPPEVETPGALGGIEKTPGVAAAVGVAENLREVVGPVSLGKEIVGGALDALSNTDQAAREFAQWGERQLGVKLGGVVHDENGFRFASSDETYTADSAVQKLLAKVTPDEPKTLAGRMIRGAAQFLAGFVVAGKIPGISALAETGAVGTYSAVAIKGAISQGVGFDPYMARLSNFIEEFPKLRNPITAYLKADPTDGPAEARLKSTLEGVGLGVVTDGLVRGIRLVRNGIRARAAFQPAEGAAAPSLDEAHAALDQLHAQKSALGELIGDADEPLFRVGEVIHDPPPSTAASLAAPKDEAAREVFINWSRIDSTDDVKNVLQNMADGLSGDVNAARRGVRTWEATALSAEQENAFKILSERRVGDALNAEQLRASKQLWIRSGSRLHELANATAADPESELKQIAFMKMFNVHATVQDHFLGARSEAARSLNILRMPTGQGSQLLRQFDDLRVMMRTKGGAKGIGDLAARVKSLGDAGMVDSLDTFTRRGRFAQTYHGMVQNWYAALLSGPKTHVVNVAASTANMLWEIGERKGAQWVSAAIGEPSGIDGETTAMAFGMLRGFKNALHVSSKLGQVLKVAHAQGGITGARKAIANSAPEDLGGLYRVLAGGESHYGGFSGKAADVGAGGEWAPEKFGITPDSYLGRVFGGWDAVTTAPGVALRAEDEFTRAMAFESEMGRLAHLRAQGALQKGTIGADALPQHVEDLLHADESALEMQAELFARRVTLNDPIPHTMLGGMLSKWSRVPVLGPLTMTFPRILYATQKQFLSRTPLAFFSPEVRSAIARGGDSRNLALSKIAMGSAAMGTFAELALNGRITGRGPKDRQALSELQATGWLPYSAKVGNRYYQFRSFSPLSNFLAFAGDLGELAKFTDWEKPDQDIADITAQATAALVTQMTASTFTQGLSTVVDAMDDPSKWESFFQRTFAAAAVPNIVANFEPAKDPVMRDAFTALDKARARTPGLSEGLPATLDVWGRKVSVASGFGRLFDAISPMASRASHVTPVDRELFRLEHYVGKPSPTQSFDGVRVDLTKYPGAYERFAELSGKAAFEDLTQMITDPRSGYEALTDGPDGAKALEIDAVLRDARRYARLQLLSENQGLADDVDARSQAAAEALVGER